MEAIVLSIKRAWEAFHGIHLTTAKVECPYCGGISSHGFGDRTEILGQFRGCDTCHLTYSVSFIVGV